LIFLIREFLIKSKIVNQCSIFKGDKWRRPGENSDT